MYLFSVNTNNDNDDKGDGEDPGHRLLVDGIQKTSKTLTTTKEGSESSRHFAPILWDVGSRQNSYFTTTNTFLWTKTGIVCLP